MRSKMMVWTLVGGCLAGGPGAGCAANVPDGEPTATEEKQVSGRGTLTGTYAQLLETSGEAWVVHPVGRDADVFSGDTFGEEVSFSVRIGAVGKELQVPKEEISEAPDFKARAVDVTIDAEGSGAKQSVTSESFKKVNYSWSVSCKTDVVTSGTYPPAKTHFFARLGDVPQACVSTTLDGNIRRRVLDGIAFASETVAVSFVVGKGKDARKLFIQIRYKDPTFWNSLESIFQ